MSDRLEGTHFGSGGLKGGLNRGNVPDNERTFQAPTGKPNGNPLLGFDKLAAPSPEKGTLIVTYQ